MESLEERIERERAKVTIQLRKQLAPQVPDATVSVAENILWQESIGLRVEHSRTILSELPDEKTVEVYIARAADKKHVGNATIFALERTMRREAESIGQRVRARSRHGRLARSALATTAEPEPTELFEGRWSVVIVSLLFLLVAILVLWCTWPPTKEKSWYLNVRAVCVPH